MKVDITLEEKEFLFTLVKHLLGAPIRKIEIADEQLESALFMAIDEYSGKLNEWITENQWPSLLGLDLPVQDFTVALTNFTLDFEKRYSYAYSKIVGLQTVGPWELKQDFIELVRNQQQYIIPAGREVNEVLWFTPPPLFRAFNDGFYTSFINPTVATNAAGAFNPTGHYIMPAHDYLLRLTDVSLKNRMLFGDLIYKITGGPNGTKILHLMPTPGGRFDFNAMKYNGSKVYYWYYDVNNKNPEDCRKDNPDIIKYPTQVPLQLLSYTQMNQTAKNDVRKLFISHTKEMLGRVRGKYSGQVKIGEAEVTLDYDALLNEAKEERKEFMDKLSERLEKLNPQKIMERVAQQAENHNKSLQFHPFPAPIIHI